MLRTQNSENLISPEKKNFKTREKNSEKKNWWKRGRGGGGKGEKKEGAREEFALFYILS